MATLTLPHVPEDRLEHLCEPAVWQAWQAAQQVWWRLGPVVFRADRMAGGQLDQAGRAWQAASDAEDVARKRARKSANARIQQDDVLAFLKTKRIGADLQAIKASEWLSLDKYGRKQRDGSWVADGTRYYELCFLNKRAELLPQQVIMAYGAPELLADWEPLEARGHAEGWTGRRRDLVPIVHFLNVVQARAAQNDPARQARTELRRRFLDALQAGPWVMRCAPDPAAGLLGGTLSAEQVRRLEWPGDHLCLRTREGELLALRDPRVKPAERAAPASSRKRLSPEVEAEARNWLCSEMGNKDRQTKAVWHQEVRDRFPGLSNAAFDSAWRRAAQKHPDKLFWGAPPKASV